MKRSAAFIFSMIIAVAILIVALSVASAAPLPQGKIFSFTSTTGNPSAEPGQVFTVTMAVAPLPPMVDMGVLTFTATSPNVLFPGWLEIVTDSVQGAGASYDPVNDVVVWNGSVGPASPVQQVTFQYRVKDPTPLQPPMVLTPTSYIGIDPAVAQSIPGSLPGTLPWYPGSLPPGMHGAAWDNVTVVAPSCVPVTGIDFTFVPTAPVKGQSMLFTSSYTPPSATPPTAYAWDFSDLYPSTGITTPHMFEAAGIYTVTLTATSCGQSVTMQHAVTVQDGAVALIGPGGGTLVYTSTQGTGFSLSIPAGALTQMITLVYAPQGAPSSGPSGMDYAGVSFDLDAYLGTALLPGFVFGLPVTFTVGYTGTTSRTDARLATVNETSLKLYYGPNWLDVATTCTPPSTYMRDYAANTFSVAVCHLSRFAVFGISEYKLYLPLIFKVAL